MLVDVSKTVAESGVTLDFDDSVAKFIVGNVADKSLGARPLRRRIRELIEDELSTMFIGGVVAAGDKITCRVEENKLVFQKTNAILSTEI